MILLSKGGGEGHDYWRVVVKQDIIEPNRGKAALLQQFFYQDLQNISDSGHYQKNIYNFQKRVICNGNPLLC